MSVTTSNHTGTTSHSGGMSARGASGGNASRNTRSNGVGKSKSSAKATGHSMKSSFEHKTTKATGASAAKAKGTTAHAHISSYTHKGAVNQMAAGTITVNGHTYSFKSGGTRLGSLPKGTYNVTHKTNNNLPGAMKVNGFGYKYNLTDKYDQRVGRVRDSLRIHPDGGRPGTAGCIGIQGNQATQRSFQKDIEAELKRNGGHFSLSVD